MLNYAPCHEVVWVSGGNAPLFHLQHIVEIVVSFMPWPLNLWYSIDRRMGGPQCQPGCILFAPAGIQIPTHWLSSPYPSHCEFNFGLVIKLILQ